MKKLFLIILLSLLPSLAFAQSKTVPVSPICTSASGSAQCSYVPIPGTAASIPINISTATTTLLVSGQSGRSIYVTQMNVVAAGTGNIQFIAGTGSTCGTGTVNVTGNYNFVAQTGISVGTGNGSIWVLPSGFNLCAVSSAAVGMAGSLAYANY